MTAHKPQTSLAGIVLLCVFAPLGLCVEMTGFRAPGTGAAFQYVAAPGVFSLRQLLDELQTSGHLVRLNDEVDANLEAAEIHRRVYARGGPAVLYASVKGCGFPMVSNLFGTLERARYLFRHTYESVRRAIELKIDAGRALRDPLRYAAAPLTAWRMQPRRTSAGPVLHAQTTIGQLPQLKCWPDDGGAFVTLPQCYTEDVNQPGLAHSNLGMYRVQLSGGTYVP